MLRLFPATQPLTLWAARFRRKVFRKTTLTTHAWGVEAGGRSFQLLGRADQDFAPWSASGKS